MVRLMLTLTPVVCMLSAVAFSSVFEHYMGDDTKREKPPAEDSSDEDDKRNSGNLYDKVITFSFFFSFCEKTNCANFCRHNPGLFFFPASHCVDCSDFSSWIRLKKVLSDTVIAPSRVWVWQLPPPAPADLINCDSTVIQLQLFDAVATTSAHPLYSIFKVSAVFTFKSLCFPCFVLFFLFFPRFSPVSVCALI